MKRLSLNRRETALFLAPLGILALMLPLWLRSREEQRSLTCRSNLYNLNLAMAQYQDDYNDYYPPQPRTEAHFTPYGWADMMLFYVRDPARLRCPSDATLFSNNPRQSGYTSYWMNSNLYGKRMRDVADSHPILFGEGSDGKDVTDARYAKSSLPSWVRQRSGPAIRHIWIATDFRLGATYAWAMGTASWQSPDEVMRRTGLSFTRVVPQPPKTSAQKSVMARKER